ncbi:MAG: PEP/pyruvate-binding domain-containing protein [Patescibacteria group bacterium]|jgi:pyruvate,water dikinase
MKYSRLFHELTKKDTDIAGGKGASLGEMVQINIPIPPGFVVLAGSFDHFLEKNEIKADIEAILEKVNHQDINSVDGASAEIQSIIHHMPFPEDIAQEALKQFSELNTIYVAVRSSATAEDSSAASWAGELESYLNVTEDALLDCIRKCWASLFTPRAIFYRFENKMNLEKVSVAVVVQKMVQSDVSGIVFTVHPVTKDENQMIIEAGYGLGEAIVGGKITPDNYIINKSTLDITNKYISEQSMMIIKAKDAPTKEEEIPQADRGKQKLADDKIIDLAKICLNIEKHYGFPCDIEWAMEKNRLYIVQSRPITTL